MFREQKYICFKFVKNFHIHFVAHTDKLGCVGTFKTLFTLLETLIYLIADVTHMPKSNIASLASLLICLLKLNYGKKHIIVSFCCVCMCIYNINIYIYI